MLVPLTRRAAAGGFVALYVAVFPANVNMAVNHIGFGRHPGPAWRAWARLPLQALLIAVGVLVHALDQPSSTSPVK